MGEYKKRPNVLSLEVSKSQKKREWKKGTYVRSKNLLEYIRV